jgi:hypothetical protein
MADYFKDFTLPITTAAVTAIVTVLIKDYSPRLWRAYQNRRIGPQKAHLQLQMNLAHWFDERAEKLAALSFQLGQEPKRDRFQLRLLISKLDQQDSEWAMKQTDIEILQKAATAKGAECRENAAECRRSAEEIAHKIFW